MVSRNEANVEHAIDDLRVTLEDFAQRSNAIARNLEETTRNLSEFSAQVRENPGVLLRGRPKPEEPAS